jgi:hypothetical protein
MWRYIAQSVAGSAHSSDGTSCQDHCAVRVFDAGDASALVACVADGAGSTKHGGVGARMACDAVLAHAATFFENEDVVADLTAQKVLSWCDKARREIADYAELQETPFRDFAATLCVVVMVPGRTVFFQVGDGAIVASRQGVMGVVFWPQSGEYVNTTHFLTSPDFLNHVQTLAVDGEFSDVALLTDGIERLALQFDSRTPHTRFFAPLFRVLRATADADGLQRDLVQFLESESIRNKTDDDRTLVLTSRVNAAAELR